MSLLVWLPMTKDLSNQGLENISITNSGITLDNNGKLGKCYSFDGKYLQFTNPLPSTCSEFSVCGWVRLTSGYTANNGLHLLSFQQTYGRICISKDGLAVRVLLTDGSKNYMGGSTSTSSAVTAGVWNHYAVTFKSGVVKVYINGILDSSAISTVTAPKFTESSCRIGTYSSEAAKGCVNDFRLYNHELSAKEVEILSRGLVCHYPLNGGGRGGDNIITDTSPNEVQYTYPSSSYSDKFSKTSTIVPSASQYVLSFWAKSTHAGDKVRAHWYSPNTTTKAETNQESISTVADGQIDFTLSDKWEKYWCVWTQSSTTAVKHFIFPRMFSQASGGATGTGTVSVKCVKLEEGNIPTPWIPNSADSAYTAMGYDSTTEYDVSGNGYNGTKNGTFTYDSNTARYSVSTKCSGSNYVSLTSPSAEVKTVSFWANWDSIPSGQSLLFLDYKSRIGFGLAFNGIIPGLYSGNYNTFSKSALVANKWYHFVIVNTGTDYTSLGRKLYINGVEQTATSNVNVWSYSVDQTQIGKRSTTSDGFVGKMSDVRMYATALSAAQVAELYNTAVSVANNGTLMGYELVEG